MHYGISCNGTPLPIRWLAHRAISPSAFVCLAKHMKPSFFQGVPRDKIKFVRAIAHQVGAGWQRASGPDGDCWVHPFWEDGVLWVEQMPDCT